jgi:hypothetical protein
MTHQVVKWVLKLWYDMGEVKPIGLGRKKKKRKRVMLAHEMEVCGSAITVYPTDTQHHLHPLCLVGLVQCYPDMYLDEMQNQLQQIHGIIVGISTIWETLKELGLSCKKVCSFGTICNVYQS